MLLYQNNTHTTIPVSVVTYFKLTTQRRPQYGARVSVTRGSSSWFWLEANWHMHHCMLLMPKRVLEVEEQLIGHLMVNIFFTKAPNMTLLLILPWVTILARLPILEASSDTRQ